jgi:hypothetical protein
MRRLLLARTVLGAIGVAVWAIGYRTDDASIRLASIGILAVALLLRFVPARYVESDQERVEREAREAREPDEPRL